MVKKGDDEEEEDEIEEDMELIKEENRNEYDLQLSIAEAMGIIFKTHKELSGNLTTQLFQQILPAAINNTEKQKQKFALFILDDMVEFLGYQYLGDNYVQVAKQIIHFCSSPVPAIRQAACYGIGMMAQNGGETYKLVANDCIQGLKTAIEFHAPSGDKKSKLKQYNHAKDNAVAALGKIIKYQTSTIDPAQFVPHWISMLPLKHDIDESQGQNEIFAQILTEQPLLVLGEQFQRFEQVILILGEILQKKYVNENTGKLLATFIKNASIDANLGPVFKTIYDNKLSNEAKERIQQAIQFV